MPSVSALHGAGAALLLVAASASPAASQESIAADRPGIGSGSFVLEARTIQVETGAELATSDPVDRYTLGQLLVRLGTGAFELQAALGSYVVQRSDGADAEGLQDITLSAKVPLPGASTEGRSISALVSVGLPTGAASQTSDEVVPSVTLLADQGLANGWALALNLGYALGPGDVEETFSVIVTPSVALPMTRNLGAYFGYAGLFSSADQHFAEGGLALAASPDLQLDLNGGVELRTGDYFIGLGAAFRRRGGR